MCDSDEAVTSLAELISLRAEDSVLLLLTSDCVELVLLVVSELELEAEL